MMRFELGGSGYCIKIHEGVGWRKSSSLSFRFPVLGLKNCRHPPESIGCQRSGRWLRKVAGTRPLTVVPHHPGTAHTISLEQLPPGSHPASARLGR
jgi:hypothetical protein